MALVHTVRLACLAMATRFECVLRCEDTAHARAVGEEAIAEIDLIARRFSFYDPGSELVQINRTAGSRPVFLAPDLFDLISCSLDIARMTGGAFDPTVGPLMRSWGFVGGTGSIPEQDAWKQAMARTGYSGVRLNPEDRTIKFELPGIELDLGGIAKGYALDEAAQIIRDGGIQSALIHGGTSTAVGVGEDTQGQPWRIGIVDATNNLLGSVSCCDHAFSVSAQSGKSFVANDIAYGHVLNPRTGRPAKDVQLAAVAAKTATAADALSTAALVLGSNNSGMAGSCMGWATLSASSEAGPSVFEVHGLPDFRQDHDSKEQSPAYRIFDD